MAERPWTDSETETLKRLWIEGLSASEVATKLGTGRSRNSIIGRVHRLDLPRRGRPVRAVVVRPRIRKPAKSRPPRDMSVTRWRSSPPKPRAPVHVDPTDAASVMARTLLASAYAADRRRSAMREAPRL